MLAGMGGNGSPVVGCSWTYLDPQGGAWYPQDPKEVFLYVAILTFPPVKQVSQFPLQSRLPIPRRAAELLERGAALRRLPQSCRLCFGRSRSSRFSIPYL